MFLSLEKTLRMRFRVRWIVRLCALLILTWVVYSTIESLWRPVVSMAMEATARPNSAGRNPGMYPGSTYSGGDAGAAVLQSMVSIVRLVPELALAILLFRFNRHIARWCVPLPLWKCPKCDHDSTDQAVRCNECGLGFGLGAAPGGVFPAPGYIDFTAPPTSAKT